MDDSNKTIRQQLSECLMAHEYTLSELSKMFNLSMNDTRFHLEKIAYQNPITIGDVRCKHCSFLFKGRKKFTRPGKCPECRSRHQDEPGLSID